MCLSRTDVLNNEFVSRFYHTVTHELYSHRAMIEKLIGDEVTGFFVPGFAGPDHASLALQSAQAILTATGHAEPGRLPDQGLTPRRLELKGRSEPVDAWVLRLLGGAP